MATEKKFSPLTVDNVKENSLRKGTFQAQIRQSVQSVTTYTRSHNNDLFSFEDESGTAFENTSQRVFWLDVPADATVKTVEAVIAKFPNARIVQLLCSDLENYLSEGQKAAIEKGLITLDEIADGSMVRSSDGEIVLQDGRPFYRILRFDKEGKMCDEDLRDSALTYIPQALATML